MLTLARFLLGFTQAFCFVYAPVWINEFSPKAKSTRWMATNQAFTAVGIIFGYAVGALIVDMTPENNYFNLDWRKGFAVQGFALIVIAFGFMCFDNSRLDIFGDRIPDVPMNVEIKSVHSRLSQKTRRDVAVEKFGDSLPIAEFIDLLKNRVYFYTMMSLCAIYFSSAALQFWCTNYIITVVRV